MNGQAAGKTCISKERKITCNWLTFSGSVEGFQANPSNSKVPHFNFVNGGPLYGTIFATSYLLDFGSGSTAILFEAALCSLVESEREP